MLLSQPCRAETPKRVKAGLLHADRFKNRVKLPAQQIRLLKRLACAGGKQQLKALAIHRALVEQSRHH